MPSPQKFSDAFLRALLNKPIVSDRRISDGACPGLRIRLRPNREPQWEHVFTRDGKTNYPSLGIYPDVSLAEARQLVEGRRRELARGPIPVSPKEAQKAATAKSKDDATHSTTVARLYQQWFELEIATALRDSGKLIAGHFSRHILPVLGAMPPEQVMRKDVMTVLDTIKTRGKKRTANVVLQLMKRLFDFALERDLVPANPAAAVRRKSAGGAEKSRDRFLSEKEIKQLAIALAATSMTATNQAAIWVLVSTLVRVGALYEAKWADIDLDIDSRNSIWRAWDQKKKGEREQYDVVLSDFARRHFRMIRNQQDDAGIKSEWVMHSRTSKNKLDARAKPATLNNQIQDRQGFRKLKNRASTAELKLPGGKWKIHDLRRTGSSRMKALGIKAEVRRACMNHNSDDALEEIYDREPIPLSIRKEAFDKLGQNLTVLTKP